MTLALTPGLKDTWNLLSLPRPQVNSEQRIRRRKRRSFKQNAGRFGKSISLVFRYVYMHLSDILLNRFLLNLASSEGERSRQTSSTSKGGEPFGRTSTSSVFVKPIAEAGVLAYQRLIIPFVCLVICFIKYILTHYKSCVFITPNTQIVTRLPPSTPTAAPNV